MSIQLLDNTRKLHSILKNPADAGISFEQIASILSDILLSEVYVLSAKGKILGMSYMAAENLLEELSADEKGQFIDGKLNERFLMALSTQDNVYLPSYGFRKEKGKLHSIIVPIEAAMERFGTLFIYRDSNIYDVEEIVLCEYGATIIGLEILRCERIQKAMETDHEKLVLESLYTLTGAEIKALKYVFETLQGTCGVFVASDVADRYGITRSVIVVALKKLRCAGIIESKSAGKNGTKVKLLVDVPIRDYIESVIGKDSR